MQQRLLQTALFVCGTAAIAASASATNWLQFDYDQAHSGNNTAETAFATASATKLAYAGVSLPSGDVVDSAPIYLANVTTASGTKNILYAVTKNGTLVAFDASNGSVLWHQQPTSTGGNLTTGSPAVDPSLAFVYAYGLDGKVHKYAVGTGVETTTNGWPEVSTVKTSVEKGAAGLAIATAKSGVTYLYSVIDGYIGDGGDYQGHITTINLTLGQATFAQNIFNTQCSDATAQHFILNGVTAAQATMASPQTDCAGVQSGIWGRPGTIYNAATDRIYIATGNGTYDPANGAGHLWADSLLALNPDGTGSNGKPLANYTPSTYTSLQSNDADVGSTAMAIVPAEASSNYAHLAVIGGKDGCMRLLNLDGMNTVASTANTGTQAGELQAVSIPSSTNQCATGKNGDNIRTQPAIWVNPADSSTWVFLATDGGIVAYQITYASGVPSLTQKWAGGSLHISAPGGTSPVVANNILYYVTSNKVQALNPVSGDLIWSDTSIGSIHWQSPIVADGHLYVIDGGSKLWSYALGDGIFQDGLQ